LAVYLNDTREQFDRFEKTAKDMLPDVDYRETTNRRRRRKTRRKQDNDGDTVDAV